MQRFFTDTIESRFVKHILHEIFLPIIDTVSDGDYVFKDKFYVYKQSLLQCRKSGYLFPQKSSNKDSIPYSEPIADVIVKETYIPYTMYPKYCNRFISKNVFYDTETHKRLGKYLRFFRDIYDIDLMPFYNCYAGETVNNIHLEPTILASTSEEITYSYNYSPQLKTYKIPIKFNKKYTVAIDAPSEVVIAPCILLKGNLETINGIDLNTLPTQGESKPLYSYSKRYYDLSFKKPILFELPCDNVTLYEHQKDLSLLIQVPISNNSSMVVLEGDYVDLDVNVIFNLDGYNELNDKDMNNALISNLHLLQINDGVRYAFSDRLIEYLVRNVITPRDRLGMNIQRVQQSGLNMTYPNTYLGVWFPEMRYILYRKYMNDSSTNKLDINGFVDVNIEKYINKIGQ